MDLVADDSSVCNSWSRTLHRMINAAKNIEVQKQYEIYLRNQVQYKTCFKLFRPE